MKPGDYWVQYLNMTPEIFHWDGKSWWQHDSPTELRKGDKVLEAVRTPDEIRELLQKQREADALWLQGKFGVGSLFHTALPEELLRRPKCALK